MVVLDGTRYVLGTYSPEEYAMKRLLVSIFLPLAAVSLALAGCDDDTAGPQDGGSADLSASAGDLGPAGGPVVGEQDNHCANVDDAGAKVQETSQASCHVGEDGGVAAIDYGKTMNNSSGVDDDCKYNISFTVTPVHQNQDTTFVVKATNTSDGKAVTGADIRAEVYLSQTHPAPNSGAKGTESANGTYTITPVRFDASGKWIVRFHLFESCSDGAEDSPHGHAAFYINVP
jgi:hypothetical protein